PKLTYVGSDIFAFQEGATDWQLKVSEANIAFQATIGARHGKSMPPHIFAFSASAGDSLTTDADGHLHVGSGIKISRPIVMGADKKVYFACSPWSQDGRNMSF